MASFFYILLSLKALTLLTILVLIILKKQSKHSKTIPENIQHISHFFKQNIYLFLKKQQNYALIFFSILFLIFIVAANFNVISWLKIVIFLLGVLTVFITDIKLFKQSLKRLPKEINKNNISSVSYHDIFISLTSYLSILSLIFLIPIGLIHFQLIEFNSLATFLGIESLNSEINQQSSSFLKQQMILHFTIYHTAILSLFYAAGIVLTCIIYHLFSSLFSRNMIITQQTSALLNYNFNNTDIRNPSSMHTLIGKYLSANLEIMLLFKAVFAITVSLLMVLSSLFTLHESSFQSLYTIFIPLIIALISIWQILGKEIIFDQINSIKNTHQAANKIFIIMIFITAITFMSNLISNKIAMALFLSFLQAYFLIKFIINKLGIHSQYTEIVRSNISSNIFAGLSAAFMIGIKAWILPLLVYMTCSFTIFKYFNGNIDFTYGVFGILLTTFSMFCFTIPFLAVIIQEGNINVYNNIKKMLSNTVKTKTNSDTLSSLFLYFQVILTFLIWALLLGFIFIYVIEYATILQTKEAVTGTLAIINFEHLSISQVSSSLKIFALSGEFIFGLLLGILFILLMICLFMTKSTQLISFVSHFSTQELKRYPQILSGKVLPRFDILSNKYIDKIKKSLKPFFISLIITALTLSALCGINGVIGFLISSFLSYIFLSSVFLITSHLLSKAYDAQNLSSPEFTEESFIGKGFSYIFSNSLLNNISLILIAINFLLLAFSYLSIWQPLF